METLIKAFSKPDLHCEAANPPAKPTTLIAANLDGYTGKEPER